MYKQYAKQKRNIWLSPLVLYAVMIMLGILCGMSEISFLKTIGIFIAEIFIKIFKCISLPIIALSIIVTLSSYSSEGILRTVWWRTLFYTLATTFIAASISCVLYIFIHPGMVNSVLPSAQIGDQLANIDYTQHLARLIPSTIFSPFLEQQVLSVLFLGVVIGIAIRMIPDAEAKAAISHFFRGAHSLFMVITRWVITIIPLGLFGFITTTVIQLRSGTSIEGIGEYLLVIVLANLVQGFIVLPLWLKYQGINPFAAMQRMFPALSLAFFSKSSVGTLPVTMDTIEKNLQVKPQVSRVVLPLCTSINMNGCAAFIFVTVIYLMQNYGIQVSLSTMALWIVIATIAAIGNAGVPMGCFFLSTSLLASMNVPIVLMGIILPFYSLIDMLESALNVWSDVCVAKIVDTKVSASSAH